MNCQEATGLPRRYLSEVAKTNPVERIVQASRDSVSSHSVKQKRAATGWLLALPLITQLLTAQTSTTITDSVSPLAVGAGSPSSSYSLSGLDTVDLYSGSNYINIPLYQVGGRGSVAYPLSLQLQNRWTIWGTSNSDGSQVLSVSSKGVGGISPWNPLLKGVVVSREIASNPNAGYYTFCRSGSGYSYFRSTVVTKATFLDAGGAEHTLVDTRYGGQDLLPYTSPTCQTNPNSGTNRGRLFRADDGSNILFQSDTDVVDVIAFIGLNPGSLQSPLTGWLEFPDGHKQRVENGNTTLIQDRNGNQISFNGSVMTDPLGRQINFSPSGVTYPGSNGASRQITINSSSLASLIPGGQPSTYQQLFPDLNPNTGGTYNPSVPSSITLPDGNSYQFTYTPYGEIASIKLPTGGMIAFDYPISMNNDCTTSCSLPTTDSNGNTNGGVIVRRLLGRREYTDASGSVLTHQTIYSTAFNNGSVVSTVTDKDGAGNVLKVTRHHFVGNFVADAGSTVTPWQDGRETLTEVLSPTGALLQQQQQTWTQRPCSSGENCWYGSSTSPNAIVHDPQVCQKFTILDNGFSAATQLAYDQYNNVTDQWVYNLNGGPAPGSACQAPSTNGLLSHTATTYVVGYSDPSIYLVSLPQTVSVYDSTNKEVAHSYYVYDQQPLQDAPGMVGHNASFSTGYASRGNLTALGKSQTGSDTIDSWTQFTFDIAGNIVKAFDPKGNQTAYAYNGDGANVYAFPTSTTKVRSGNPSQTTSTSYDYSIGKATSVTDVRGTTAFYSYQDLLDRLIRVDQKANGTTLHSTTYSYPDSRTVTAFQDLVTPGDLKVQSQTIADGFGRPIESRQYETGSQYISTTTGYDALGRVAVVTNPTRGTSPTSNDGFGYPTRTSYDALNRTVQVVAADGSITNTSYSGNQTLITDPAGKQRLTAVDALGRLAQIMEDPAGLKYLTTYTYDPLGNLLLVNQSGQIRSFVYDGLSRLTRATNPESATTNYTYDAASNLLTKTDARGVVTCFGNISGTTCDNSGYDDLNRVVRKSYSDGTPAITYSYDVGGGLFTGRLTSIANASSTTNYNSYDALGRILSSTQVTQGHSYSFAYAYNAAGSLTSERYPSGRVVQTGYDTAGRPAWLQGNRSGFLTNYIANPNDPNSWTNYWPHGAIHYYVQGNNILHAISFNPRLQQTESYDAIGNAPDLNHLLFVSCPNWGNSANPQVYDFCPHPAAVPSNGNLVGYDEYHGGPGYSQFLSFHQSFTYDGANRLQNASDSGGWSRTFNYDPYGNMWATNVTGVATGAPSSNVYNGANNQIPNTPYDAAGNLKVVNGNTLFYDGENQQVAVSEAPAYGGGTEQYWFDGNGQRVAKAGPSGTFIYVYDAAGQLIAEYASAATAAAPCSTCYLSTDHLGTPRLVTDENATVISRHDYFPFGEEVPANQVGRDAHFGFGNDTVSQKFTGQMRDIETGEDFFNARMFGSGIGRFTSPDPRNAGADSKNPQSWNGYAYVTNNPLNGTDSTGKFKDAWFDGTPPCFMCGGSGGQVGYSGDAGTLGTYSSNSRGSDFIRSPNGLGGNYAQGEASYLDLVQQAFQGLQKPANPASNGATHSCLAQRVVNAIPGAQLTGREIAQGGHEQFGIAVNTADLAAAGFQPFKVLGFFPNGYHNGSLFLQVHVNGQNGAQLSGAATGIINVQGHFDVFNPAAGYGAGLLLHGIYDLGIGSLFFSHSSALDPGCSN